MHLLLVEDDQKLGPYIQKGLVQEGHVVDWVQDGADAVVHAESRTYDAAIVDVMLPRMDGLSFVRALRRKKHLTPVIMLSAKSNVDDKVAGLHAGADDYLAKPFSFAELVARLQALLRRTGQASAATTLTFADVEMNLLTRRVTRGGVDISLQAKEFALLELFLRNAERVLSKTMILERIWDYNFDPQTNVVDVLVSRLRAKLDRDHPTKLIHTLRGVGYVLRGS